jgi:hypothetical protein
MVMVAVHHVHEFFGPFAVCHPMKDKAMHQIFEKTPEKHSAQEGEDDPHQGVIQPRSAVIQEIYNDWHINAPNHQGMRLGEHLQVVIPEQLGLPLIMYFLEFHDSTIWQKYE